MGCMFPTREVGRTDLSCWVVSDSAEHHMFNQVIQRGLSVRLQTNDQSRVATGSIDPQDRAATTIAAAIAGVLYAFSGGAYAADQPRSVTSADSNSLEEVVVTASARAVKKLDRRNPTLLDALQTALLQLESDPYHPSLRTHKLSGDFAGCWACSAGYDFRIVFEFVRAAKGGVTEIHLLNVGTHDEVY